MTGTVVLGNGCLFFDHRSAGIVTLPDSSVTVNDFVHARDTCPICKEPCFLGILTGACGVSSQWCRLML